MKENIRIEYVCGFMFDLTMKKVILIQKNKPEWQKGLLNGVGGKIEIIDDSINHAMSREFLEETGLKTNAKDWNHFCNITDNENTYRVHFFHTTNENYNDYATMEEELVICINVDELHRHKTIPNLQWLIPMCLDNYNLFSNIISKQ